MIVGLDSAYPPSAAAIAKAKAAGRGMWNGYFAGPHILNGWSRADFDRVKAGGLATMAYCSGWSNAAAMKSQSASWDVRICLDCEGGIRGDGPWVQPWLDTSGAGLYANYWVHPGKRAPFHVLCAFPTSGDPTAATWWSSSARPAGPCGWQWVGTHTEFGVGVDRGDYDDWFGGLQSGGSGSLEADMTPEEHGWLADIRTQVATSFSNQRIMASLGFDPALPQAPTLAAILRGLADLKTAIDAVSAGSGGGLSAVDSQKLDGLIATAEAIRLRVEKDLAP